MSINDPKNRGDSDVSHPFRVKITACPTSPRPPDRCPAAPGWAGARKDRRIKQHTHGDEEKHSEGILQRQRILTRLMAERGLAQYHTGKERPQSEGHPEKRRGAPGDPQRHRKHCERQRARG
jgi:hypothetical protein